MEKYTYIRKTITWENRRYEVRGKTEQEACDKLAELVASLNRGEFATSGNTTVDQWFLQWKETYKAPSGLTQKSLGLYDEKYNGYIGPAIGTLKLKRRTRPSSANHPQYPSGDVILACIQTAYGNAGALPAGTPVPADYL